MLSPIGEVCAFAPLPPPLLQVVITLLSQRLIVDHLAQLAHGHVDAAPPDDRPVVVSPPEVGQVRLVVTVQVQQVLCQGAHAAKVLHVDERVLGHHQGEVVSEVEI